MLEKVSSQNNLIDLTDLGLIRVSGKDAKQFLQGQLTCNLEEINTQQSRLGLHCDIKGRIIASFRLFFYQNDYYFLLPQSMQSLLLTSLQKYAVFSKVTLGITQDWQKFGLYGPTIKHTLEKLGLYVPKENEVAESNHQLNLSIPGPAPRTILLTRMNDSIDLMDVKFKQHRLEYWHLLDIMAGIPTIYPETSGQFTPHQLNFPEIGGVSFNKGCYIGQEIIARTHYLGKSKSRLYRVSFPGNDPFLPGTVLLENDQKTETGTLIMSAKEQKNRYQGLVCLQTQAISHTIRLNSLEGPKLDFLELPYFVN